MDLMELMQVEQNRWIAAAIIWTLVFAIRDFQQRIINRKEK